MRFSSPRDGGEVIGWTHVSVSYLLEVPLRAEINGLIVSDNEPEPRDWCAFAGSGGSLGANEKM